MVNFCSLWYNNYMQKYNLETLNDEQKQALLQTEGAVLVTAGAGSGKTRLLTHRIAYLIKEKKVNPYNILAITFTNKAANEMLERTSAMLDGFVDPWISTFHSMCAKILRFDIDKLGYKKSFSIYSDSDTDKLLDQILQEQNLADDKKDFKKTCSFHIANCKNNNMSMQEYHQAFITVTDIDKIMSVFAAYQNRLFENNALDFNDLLNLTYKLLAEHKEVRDFYTNRFQYILVDEFQDTNVVQYELVKLLSSVHKNIFVVGDEDQCIYSWRGASYKNIKRFTKDFDVKMFKLETNYRSTPNILSYANSLITNNSSRIEKNLKAVKTDGQDPEVYEAFDEQQEANFITSKIDFLVKEKGYKYSDFAVLMRVNALTLSFEQTLLSYNIPYKIFGGFKFFERAEIKNVLSYLKTFVNPQDEIALLRIINFPKRGIGDGAISKIKEIALKKRKSLLEIMLEVEEYELPSSLKNKVKSFAETYKTLYAEYEAMPLVEFVKKVIQDFDIKSGYNSNIDEEYYKIMNIDTLVSSIEEFAEKNADYGLNEYLESVTLMSDIDNMDSSDNVILATVHSVKGLEFPVVFVVGLEEKLFPISRAYDNPNDMEEERRLMYVAITRAEERLYLTYTNSRFMYGRRQYTMPSRFLKEVGYAPKLKTPVYDNGYATFSNSFTKNNYTYESKSFENSASFGIGVDNLKNTVSTQNQSKSGKDVSIYKVGQSVLHTRFGLGKIIAIKGTDADIKFDKLGVKTLILTLAPLEIIEE